MKYYNKINRNFLVKARLYYNENSHNRNLDSTPRFFIQVKSIDSIERLGFTHKSEDNNYIKYSANLFGGKQESFLDSTKLNEILTDLNSKPPYGFDASVVGSKEAYDNAVKFNLSYQSFYKSYWESNTSKIRNLTTEDYPFIDLEFNEIIKSKYLVKQPASFAERSISEEYTGVIEREYASYTCESGTNFAVTTGNNGYQNVFYIDGNMQQSFILGKHKQYIFTNTNTGYSEGCTTGILPFRIATGSSNGVIDGGQTLTSGVNVSGAGSLTGSEVLVLTTDEATPRLLFYHSPLSSGVGSVIYLEDSCSGALGSVTHPSFTPYAVWNSGASTSIVGGQTVVTADGVPDHCTSNNVRGWTGYPNSDNSDIISGQSYSWEIPNSPTLPSSGENHRVPMGAIGIGLNGVPIYNPYSSSGTNVTTDQFHDDCNGYVISGKYHYYKNPLCTYVDVSGEHSPIVGYAFDGHPIYGPRDESGVYVSESNLDQYHGHTQDGRGYHYHMTTGAPYVLGAYYKGIPNSGNYTSSEYPPVSGYPSSFQGV